MRLVDCSLVRFPDLLKYHLFRNFGARGGGVETKTGSSNYLGHPVPLFGGEIGCQNFLSVEGMSFNFFAIQILPKPRIEAIEAWVNHHDL